MMKSWRVRECGALARQAWVPPLLHTRCLAIMRSEKKKRAFASPLNNTLLIAVQAAHPDGGGITVTKRNSWIASHRIYKLAR